MSQTPSPYVGDYPFQHVEGNLFPPVCLKTHWDPTEMLRRILPQQSVQLPLAFRPWTKVCKQYVTSAPAETAPMPPKDMVFPTGGAFYPPGRYAASIDKESVLRTLDRPLDSSCPTTQYIPSPDSTMYVAGSTVPDRKPMSNAFVSELSFPQALLRVDTTTCRSANDNAYFQRSGRLFNNPTKQDRYGADKFYAHKDGLPQGQPMPHGGVHMPKPTASAVTGRHGAFPNPTGGAARATQAQAQEAQSKQDYIKGTLHPTEFDTYVAGTSTAGSAARVW